MDSREGGRAHRLGCLLHQEAPEHRQDGIQDQGRTHTGGAEGGQAHGILRRDDRRTLRQPVAGHTRHEEEAGIGARVQDGRYLCRRIRGEDTLLLLHIRMQGHRDLQCQGQEESGHSRRRPDQDRSGNRVRLLLRPRSHGIAGGRCRCGHSQQQSRDSIHRLRYVRQALLRTADTGRCAQCHRGRGCRRCHLSVRRTDICQSGSGPGEGPGRNEDEDPRNHS